VLCAGNIGAMDGCDGDSGGLAHRTAATTKDSLETIVAELLSPSQLLKFGSSYYYYRINTSIIIHHCSLM
jgi:hypothetical protein